tara:strand:- start:768 stop:956 length:189 start_codon:yes stop_codon:yes gene_type:complete
MVSLNYLKKINKMPTPIDAPDFVGVLSGQVPIRVEASVSPQSMLLLAIVIIVSNIISRAIIK